MAIRPAITKVLFNFQLESFDYGHWADCLICCTLHSISTFLMLKYIDILNWWWWLHIDSFVCLNIMDTLLNPFEWPFGKMRRKKTDNNNSIKLSILIELNRNKLNWISNGKIQFIVKWNHIAIMVFISHIVDRILDRVQSIQINANSKWLEIANRHVVWSVDFCFFFSLYKFGNWYSAMFYLSVVFFSSVLFMLLISFEAFHIFMDMIKIHYYELSISIWLPTIMIDSVIRFFFFFSISFCGVSKLIGFFLSLSLIFSRYQCRWNGVCLCVYVSSSNKNHFHSFARSLKLHQ